MGVAMKWLRNVVEKLLGRFYEGPTLPERFEHGVVEFANRHPNATRKEWATFAKEHASIAYEAGYVRGYERSERDYQHPRTPPEAIADATDPQWRDRVYDWRTGRVFDLGDVTEPTSVPQEASPEDYDPVQALRQHRRAIGLGSRRGS